MRVPSDFTTNKSCAPYGPSQSRTATLLALPVSSSHTVRSVAQEAYRTLWATQSDRAERWRRVSNMDQVFGVGRPLATISKPVLGVAIREMREMSMPEEVIDQHLDDFACLMLWADGWGFVTGADLPSGLRKSSLKQSCSISRRDSNEFILQTREEMNMPAYLVRLKSTRELVGIFVAADPQDLWNYVDECCDFGLCEYLPLPEGGMYHENAGAPDVPTVFKDEPGTGEKMPDWFSGATMTDGWANVFESEEGEKGWQEAPA